MVTARTNETNETYATAEAREARQDPRVKRTRELIQRAFMELIAERGFETLRVQDIAERATINRATFYAHFEDKYSLLDTVMKEQFAAEMAQRLPRSAPLTAANLRVLASAIFALADELEGHCKPTGSNVQTRPNIEAAMQRELAAFLRNWLRGAAPASINDATEIEATASVMSWAIFGAAQEWSRGERAEPLDATLRRLVAILIDGAAQSPGIAIPG
jgi:AcrR family transcriptional regulator